MMGRRSTCGTTKPKPSSGWRDVGAAIGERHRGRGGVGNPLEQMARAPDRRSGAARGLVRLRRRGSRASAGEDRAVGGGRRASRAVRARPSAARSLRRTAPGGSRAARARTSSSIPSANVTKSDQRAPLVPALERRAPGGAARHRAEDDAPLAPLHLQEARHGGGERELVGIGGVDPADQRLRHPLERLAAEPARARRRPGSRRRSPPRGSTRSQRHPELARPREEREREEGPSRVGARS